MIRGKTGKVRAPWAACKVECCSRVARLDSGGVPKASFFQPSCSMCQSSNLLPDLCPNYVQFGGDGGGSAPIHIANGSGRRSGQLVQRP